MTTTAVRPSHALVELGVPALWARELTGEGVCIAVLDSGIDSSCASLCARVTRFASVSPCGRQVDEAKWPRDRTGHGTHVAGLIVGDELDGHAIGVAPQASLIAVGVLDDGDVIARVARGLGWLLDAAVDVDIVALPLGIDADNTVWWPAIAELLARGVMVVAAAGNESKRPAPASYAQVLAASARGEVEPREGGLALPGRRIKSFGLSPSGHAILSGSSQATGYLAGLCALWRQAIPRLSNAAVLSAWADCHCETESDEYKMGPELLRRCDAHVPTSAKPMPSSLYRDPGLAKALVEPTTSQLSWLMVVDDERNEMIERWLASDEMDITRLAPRTLRVTAWCRELEMAWYDDRVRVISGVRPQPRRLFPGVGNW